MTNLDVLSFDIYQANKAKGFWDNDRNIGELCMLIVSELGEAMEAHRKGRFANWENMDGIYIPDSDFYIRFADKIKDTFEDEIADAFIRILDMLGGLYAHHIDIGVSHYLSKAAGTLNHIDNVGEMLMSIVAHINAFWEEYSDGHGHAFRALTAIICLSDRLNIDLERHVEAKLRYNLSRPRLHGKKY